MLPSLSSATCASLPPMKLGTQPPSWKLRPSSSLTITHDFPSLQHQHQQCEDAAQQGNRLQAVGVHKLVEFQRCGSSVVTW